MPVEEGIQELSKRLMHTANMSADYLQTTFVTGKFGFEELQPAK